MSNEYTNINIIGNPITGKLYKVVIDRKNTHIKCDSAIANVITNKKSVSSTHVVNKISEICKVGK